MCVGIGLGGTNVGPVPVVYQPPPWVQMTTTAPPSQAAKGPEEWVLGPTVNLGNTTHICTNTHTHFWC